MLTSEFRGARRSELVGSFSAFIGDRFKQTFLTMVARRQQAGSCGTGGPEARCPSAAAAALPQKRKMAAGACDSAAGEGAAAQQGGGAIKVARLRDGQAGLPSAESAKRGAASRSAPHAMEGDAEGEPKHACGICSETNMELMVARCSHSACSGCWEKWLQQRLECPFCRQRCRRTHLTPTPRSP